MAERTEEFELLVDGDTGDMGSNAAACHMAAGAGARHGERERVPEATFLAAVPSPTPGTTLGEAKHGVLENTCRLSDRSFSVLPT